MLSKPLLTASVAATVLACITAITWFAIRPRGTSVLPGNTVEPDTVGGGAAVLSPRENVVAGEIHELRLEIDAPASTILVTGGGTVHYARRGKWRRIPVTLSRNDMDALRDTLNRNYFFNLSSVPIPDDGLDPIHGVHGHEGSFFLLTARVKGTDGVRYRHRIQCHQFACDREFLDIKDAIIDAWTRHTDQGVL